MSLLFLKSVYVFARDAAIRANFIGQSIKLVLVIQ